MNTKNLLVSFLTIVSILFLVATVSAAFNVDGDLASDITVKVNNIEVVEASAQAYDASVIAGETVTIVVYFTSEQNASDVNIKAEIEGDKIDVDSITEDFDVESDSRYRKTLTLTVPSELKDENSGEVTLSLKMWNGEFKTEVEDITLQVQRPSYFAEVKSISASNSVDAGETFPVEIVLKNMGYNDLDDVYVTARISALNTGKTAYFGDIVVDEENSDDDDDTDTMYGRLYLSIPYDAMSGIYELVVEVTNDDTTTKEVMLINVNNDFADNVIVTSQSQTVAAGEDAEYSLLIVNPTNKLKVYKIVSESSGDVSSDVQQTVLAVPAGSSKTVKVTANAQSEGEYDFNLNVFSGDKLVETVTLSLNVKGNTVTNPIVVLTVILAIIFLVLLVVLIVLLRKKPENTEDFGESYY